MTPILSPQAVHDPQTRQTIVRLLSSMGSAKEISQYLKRFSQLDAARFAVVKVGGAVLRDDLDAAAPRRMAVMDPIKFVLTNLPEDHDETLTFSNHPKDESFGKREIPFSRELWIEREDFAEVPPKGFKRLIPGGEVRLRGAGIVRCDEVIKNEAGEIVELRGWLDPESRPGMEGAERKIKGTIH